MLNESDVRQHGELAGRRYRQQMRGRLAERLRRLRVRAADVHAGTLPACAALKTRLSPSGMKRALEMNIGSKVLICAEMLAPTAGLPPIPRLPATNPAGAPISNAAAAIAGHNHPRDVRFLSETASVFAVDVPESAAIANATSRADWNRSAGFFSRQWRMILSRPGGSGTASSMSGGSSFRTAVIVSTAVSR